MELRLGADVTVAITGASGQLGQALARRYPDAILIGHHMIEEPVDLLIHAACPDWRDERDVEDFGRFNLAVLQYVRRHQPTMVNVGSWWQIAEGTCRDLAYTRMKDYQQSLFPEARHVIAYSIYGPIKGYALEVVRHVTGQRRMTTVGTPWRDFVWVDDVADAVANASMRAPGVYGAYSRKPVQVSAVARAFGIDLPIREQGPTAELRYGDLENVATPVMSMADWIGREIALAADGKWLDQRKQWEAA